MSEHPEADAPVPEFAAPELATPEAPAPAPETWSRLSQAVALFLRGRTARTAGPTAALVGTVLSAVNQGSTIIDGPIGASTWIRVGVNYAVPFLVASIGYLSARRAPRGRG